MTSTTVSDNSINEIFDHKYYHNNDDSMKKKKNSSMIMVKKKAKIYSFNDDDLDSNDSTDDRIDTKAVDGNGNGEDDASNLMKSKTTNGSSSSTSTTIEPSNDSKQQEHQRSRSTKLMPFKSILNQIGFINLNQNGYEQLRSLFINDNHKMVNENNDQLSNIEKNLINLYKCDPVHHQQCFHTTNDSKLFHEHLIEKHRDSLLFCFYCQKSIDSNDYDQQQQQQKHTNCSDYCFENPADLIKHIDTQHSSSSLRYQCNLCFYRALTSDHILIHHTLEHTKSFLMTIKRLISKKDDPNDFDKLFLRKLKNMPTDFDHDSDDDDDDDTEIDEFEDNDHDDNRTMDSLGHHSPLNVCKILICPTSNQESQLIHDQNDDKFIEDYVEKYGIKPMSMIDEHDKQQQYSLHCAYCNEFDGQFNVDHDDDQSLWTHMIRNHREHPIIVYDSAGDDQHSPINTNLEEMIDKMYSKLFGKQRLTSRIYDEKFMLNAFESYGDQTMPLSSIPLKSSGLKRKYHNDNDDDDDDDQHEQHQQQNNDNSNNQNKRQRRLFFHRFTKSNIGQRTKNVISMATTAVIAFGFYQFAQYLPFQLQNLLDYR